MKTLRCLSPLLFTTLALLGARTAAVAQSVSPVPEPTIINSAPYTITQSGYYQLGANINYDGTGATNEAIITINASNVTLDFAGHYIAGPTTNSATHLYGIYASERANVVIQNGTISYCLYGIYMTGNGSDTTNNRNARVLNMTLTKCYFVGAALRNAISPEVSGSRVSSIGGSTYATSYAAGLDFLSSFGARAINNAITNVTNSGGNSFGIEYAVFAVGNQITNCATGIYGSTRRLNNLTSNCATPFNGGTDAGGNF